MSRDPDLRPVDEPPRFDTAARERLRRHLEREASALADVGDPDDVLGAVRRLAEQLAAEGGGR